MEKKTNPSNGRESNNGSSFFDNGDLCTSILVPYLAAPLPIDLDSLDESSLTTCCHVIGTNSSKSFVNNPLRLSGPLLPPADPKSPVPKSRQQRHNKIKRKPTVVNKYCEEMNGVNEAANSHPRSALIHSIQQENKHIRELQKENSEMRLVLEEHQNILELIMMKHRDQIKKLISLNKKKNKLPGEKDQQEYECQIASQVEQIHEMVAVMRKAALLNENEYCQQQQVISSLRTENMGLREMLQIAQRNGSVSTGTEASTQTEDWKDDYHEDDWSPNHEISNNHLGPMNGIQEEHSS